MTYLQKDTLFFFLVFFVFFWGGGGCKLSLRNRGMFPAVLLFRNDTQKGLFFSAKFEQQAFSRVITLDGEPGSTQPPSDKTDSGKSENKVDQVSDLPCVSSLSFQLRTKMTRQLKRFRQLTGTTLFYTFNMKQKQDFNKKCL